MVCQLVLNVPRYAPAEYGDQAVEFCTVEGREYLMCGEAWACNDLTKPAASGSKWWTPPPHHPLADNNTIFGGLFKVVQGRVGTLFVFLLSFLAFWLVLSSHTHTHSSPRYFVQSTHGSVDDSQYSPYHVTNRVTPGSDATTLVKGTRGLVVCAEGGVLRWGCTSWNTV
jgi:hypothetical protein